MAKVKFGDVVKEVKNKIDRNNNPYEFYVAGDHMDTDSLSIPRKGSFLTDDVGPAFIREFKKGQVLYGSRRTYLRKVAVADFDGVTANTTFVLETKDENVLRQRLLPFIMYTEGFTAWSIKKSRGSTNPYVLFKDLADYEFDLPSIEEQDRLAEVLWSIDDTLQAYQKLLTETDSLVQAQFIEMFDTNNHSFPESKIIDVCANKDDIKCGPFGTQLKQSEYETSGVAVWGISEINSDFKKSPDIFVTQEKAQNLSSFSLIPGDIAMSRKGNVGQCAIFPDTFAPGIIASDVLRIRIDANHLLPKFMQYQLHHSEKVKRQIELVSNGVVMAGINVTKLKNILVYIPPMDSQKEFVQLVDKAEKSKSTLTGAITSLKATKRSILENALGSRRKE